MAKSTPQTKPNLFGTLTQKPVKETKKDTKEHDLSSDSLKKEKKSFVSNEKNDDIANLDVDKNVVMTTAPELTSKTNVVAETTSAIPSQHEMPAKTIISNLDQDSAETHRVTSTVPVQTLEAKEIPFSNREGTNHASLLLTKTNLKFLRIRTRQLGTTLQKYVDLLLREEKERWNDEPGYADTIYDYCENRFKEEKKVMSLITSKEGNDFLNEGSIEAGIKKVTFMNYIISREIERESEGKKRESL